MPTAKAAQPTPPLLEELVTYIRARYPLVYLLSVEEQRALDDLERFARAEGKGLVVWSQARGATGKGMSAGTAQGDPLAILTAIPGLPDNTLVVLLDFHPFLGDSGVVRHLRELGRELEATRTTVLLLSPVLNLPVELQKEMVVVDLPLPGHELLERTYQEILAALPADIAVTLQPADAEKLISSAQGLTLKEFSNVLAKTLVSNGRIDRSAVDGVNSEKRQIIRKSGILDFYPAAKSFESIGGLENLKAWLLSRGRAFTDEARTFGLPWPRGILIVGVQGCGKSLTAKAVANQWRLPLLKLDMGRLFGGLVGSSEESMRRAIQLAESTAPGVLWIDELEKGLSGLGSSNVSDGGTTARVIGTFLTWLQEKTQPVFVVATSNDISALPPELLRKGRFDEIFFVDLPARVERREIFRIHVKRRGRDPERFDLDALASSTAGYSGAEIEEAVVSGLYRAFDLRRELESADLLAAAQETVPLSVVMDERITALREWAKFRTRPASSGERAVESPRATIADRLRRIAGEG
jgi:SpoVK/Ycf46/Vps4 family AAA+-type ATPase